MKLTVYYDGHFWVAVIQWQDQGLCRACRYIFGSSEPSDPLIAEFSKKEMFSLLKNNAFSASQENLDVEERFNPKRMARRVARQMKQKGPGSQAQEALRIEREQHKKERKGFSKLQRDQEQERRYVLRREKARKKQRGH
jgi:hypothetical protein